MKTILGLVLAFSVFQLMAQTSGLNVKPDTDLCPGAEVVYWVVDFEVADRFEWKFPQNMELIDGGSLLDSFIVLRAIELGGGIVEVTPFFNGLPGQRFIKPLIVTPVVPSFRQFNLCPEDFPYVIEGQEFNSYGSHEYVYTNDLGCDSLLFFSILPEVSSQIVIHSCGSDFPIEAEGKTFNNYGLFPIVYPKNEGCDSVVFVRISPPIQYTHQEEGFLCGINDCYQIGDSCYQTKGIHLARFPNYYGDGCDSVVELTLRRVDNYSSVIDTLICDIAPSIQIGNVEITEPGRRVIRLVDYLGEGCDSIVDINLEILSILPSPQIDVIDQPNGKTIEWTRPRIATHFDVFLNRNFFTQTSNNYIFLSDSLLQSKVFIKIQPLGNCEYLPAKGFIEGVTSVNEDNLTNKIYLAPNPAQNLISIQTDLQLDFVEFYDITGNFFGKRLTDKIDVSGYQSGIYILKIFTPQGVAIKKFIKN